MSPALLEAQLFNIIKHLTTGRFLRTVPFSPESFHSPREKRFNSAFFPCQKGKFLNNIFCHCLGFEALHQIRADVICATSSKIAQQDRSSAAAGDFSSDGEGLCFWVRGHRTLPD